MGDTDRFGTIDEIGPDRFGDFDPDRYRTEVLEPARRLGRPPADLLRRYAVPEALGGDEAAFAAHLERVVRHWRGLKQRQVYRDLASALLAAHAGLAAAGDLTYATFARRRDTERAVAWEALDTMATAIAATTAAVDATALSALVRSLGGVLDEEPVRRALAERGVSVVDRPWPLPAEPADADRPALATLVTNLRIAGLPLAAEAVFGTDAVRAGFRLRGGFVLRTGERITSDLLAGLRREQARRAGDERRTAVGNVLAALAAADAVPGRLEALLVWQMLEVLAPRIEAGLPPRAVAEAAADLGLDHAEAVELSLVSAGRRPRNPHPAAPSAPPPGPPPAPDGLLAAVKDERVHLTWRRPGIPVGPAGGPRYRVLRSVSAPARVPAEGTEVSRTTELSAVDDVPPAGECLYYTVLASLDDVTWSEASGAATAVVLPEVREAELVAHGGPGDGPGVTGSWRAPVGAVDVLVTCEPPGTGAPPRVNLAGFRHTGVGFGVRRRYLIRAVYEGSDGRERISAGVTRWATCEPPLATVDDLRAGDAGGGGVELVWTSPPGARVTIYRHPVPPPWPPGARTRIRELSEHGRPVPGSGRQGPDGRTRLVAGTGVGRSWFTAVTLGRDEAVVGASVCVTRVPPVTRLRADRHEETVRLEWEWPDGVHVCRVAWTDHAPGGGSLDCTRRRYLADGGVELRLARPVVVTVTAIGHDRLGEIASAPAEVGVPAPETLVRYRFRRPSALRPWAATRLVLVADRPCHVPPVLVVRSAGDSGVLPLRSGSGTPVLRLAGQDLPGGREVSVPVPDTGPGRLACFLAGPTGAGVTLVRAEADEG